MGEVTPMDLEALWKERSGLDEFKLRDQAYQVYEAAFLARSPDKKQQFVTWRPQMMDSGMTANSEEERALVNLCRQINNHHQASFARPPRIWNVPYSPETSKDADLKTAIIQGVLRRSRIKSQQPLQSWRLTNRGDAIMGLEWGKDQQGTTGQGKPFINIRNYDPAFCYPDLSKEDPGGLNDLLVTYEVRRTWAERTFNISLSGNKPSVRMFVYWDDNQKLTYIEQHLIESYSIIHGLGFVPWRWIFNSPNDHMAQSDIAEIPKLQQMLSDMVQLSMHAARKRVDKAYWGKGISGKVVPEPGKVVSFANPNAMIAEFPTTDPPEMLSGLMGMVQGYAQAMGGISPVSMEGFVSGSNVTGAAIRHQVEAIEARTETKRVSIESGYSILGEYILRVLEKAFPDQELIVQTDKGEAAMKGEMVKAWYTCEASYGGFEGLGPTERGRWALEGFGRIHSRRKAIAIAYPDEDVQTMEKDIDDDQLRQASIAAQAQATAQQIAAGGGGGPSAAPASPGPGGQTPGGGPGQPPPPGMPMNSMPQPPGQAAVAQAAGKPVVKLGELESLINVVRTRLKGAVWAIGEIAIAGQSVNPRVMVENPDDEGPVNSVLQSKNVRVTVGTPAKDEPKTSLL